MAGWIAVQRGVKINYDIETNPLEIKSGRELGSGNELYVEFYASQGEYVGGVQIDLDIDRPEYRIKNCMIHETYLPVDIPTARVKVWRITVIRSSGIIGLQILCNGEEVLNTVLSDSVCTDWSHWHEYWNRDIAKIQFSSHDTVSDYYRPYQPGN